jgi:hypothetical protein
MLSLEVITPCHLKGGETMHIRKFILMGAMLGAAAFLPDQALAEKNGAAEPPHSEVVTQGMERIEKPKASEKSVSIQAVKENKSQGGAVRKSVTKLDTQQAIRVKPDPKPPTKTNRPVEKGRPPSLDKKEKAPSPAQKSVKVKETGKAGSAKPKVVAHKLPVLPESPGLNSSNQSKQEVNSHTPIVYADAEVQIDSTGTPVSFKSGSSHKVTPKPLKNEENQMPSQPEDIEVVNSPSQRSGGSPNEQPSQGASPMGFITHWYDWDLHVILGSIYHSREVQFSFQWINAPPSPPPVSALFLNVNEVSNDM